MGGRGRGSRYGASTRVVHLNCLGPFALSPGVAYVFTNLPSRSEVRVGCMVLATIEDFGQTMEVMEVNDGEKDRRDSVGRKTSSCT